MTLLTYLLTKDWPSLRFGRVLRQRLLPGTKQAGEDFGRHYGRNECLEAHDTSNCKSAIQAGLNGRSLGRLSVPDQQHNEKRK